MNLLFILANVDSNKFQAIDVQDDIQMEDFEDSPVTRLSCFAHSVQLCVRDGLKNVPHMGKVLSKCQLLAKISHKSSKIADLLDEIDKRINKMNITRWNSEYLLVKSILSIGKVDLETIGNLVETPVKFTKNDLVVLEEIVEILEPFYEISIKCQGELPVTASMVVPAVVHLLVHLRDMKGNLSYCNKFVIQLQSSLEKRFAGIINRLNQFVVKSNDPFNDPVYFMATVLDPNFKLNWIRDLKLPVNSENRLKQNIIQLILDEISKDLRTSTLLDGNNLSSSNSRKSSPSKAKKRKLFVYDNDDDHYSSSSITVDPASELEIYLNDRTTIEFSNYWSHSRLELLKNLVKRIFSVQASSAPVERVFSYAGLILSPRRTNISEELFRDLVFLKVNQRLL